MKARIRLGGREMEVHLEALDGGRFRAVVDGEPFEVRVDRGGTEAVASVDDAVHVVGSAGRTAVRVDGHEVDLRILELHGAAGAGAAQADGAAVRPPMTGRVEAVRVREGQKVQRGDVLFVLEAMKMQNEVRSPVDGVVASVRLEAGATVDPAAVVVEIRGGDA